MLVLRHTEVVGWLLMFKQYEVRQVNMRQTTYLLSFPALPFLPRRCRRGQAADLGGEFFCEFCACFRKTGPIYGIPSGLGLPEVGTLPRPFFQFQVILLSRLIGAS